MQLRGLGIFQAGNQNQNTCPVLQQLVNRGPAWGPGHLQLSGNSDSWGGTESHSRGSGSPHWCLLGPRGWVGVGRWREGQQERQCPLTLFHHTPTQCTLHSGPLLGQVACSSAGHFSFSYLMEAIMRPSWAPTAPPLHDLSLPTPRPRPGKGADALCIFWKGQHIGSMGKGGFLCLRLSQCPSVYNEQPVLGTHP